MTEFTHGELQELLGAFALDAVDGEEYEAVELHLRECPRCRAEVAEHREIAALIGHGGAPAPEGVWDRIIAAIEPAPPEMRLEVRPAGGAAHDVDSDSDSGSDANAGPGHDVGGAAPVVPIDRERRAGRATRWNRNLLAMAAAAAVIIAVLGSVVVHLDNRVGKLSDQVASANLKDVATDALVDPNAKQIKLKSSASTVVVPAALTSDGEGYLLAGTTPALPADRTYQLWGVVGKNTISLGTFPGGAQVVAFRVDTGVKALAITEENKGGVVSSKNSAVFSATV